MTPMFVVGVAEYREVAAGTATVAGGGESCAASGATINMDATTPPAPKRTIRLNFREIRFKVTQGASRAESSVPLAMMPSARSKYRNL
jgi:hypothetical protein